MQTAKQLSISAVNKPGRLAAVLEALAKEKVASRAFCVMNSGNRGTLCFVPEEPEPAMSTIESLGIEYDLTDVLLVDVPRHSGGLRNLCRRLAAEHLNIDYVYGSLSSPGNAKGGVVAVIKVNDLTKAQRVLSEPVPVNGGRPKKRPGRRPGYAR